MENIDRLYKYGRINEYSESLLSGSEIWLAPPSELNDRFECRPWFTYDGNEREIFQLSVTAFRKRNPPATQKETIAEVTKIIAKGRHRIPGFWEALSTEVHRDLASRIGLYCLSEVPTDILMWSHYSADHKGYCLEFEATSQTAIFGELRRFNIQGNIQSWTFSRQPIRPRST